MLNEKILTVQINSVRHVLVQTKLDYMKTKIGTLASCVRGEKRSIISKLRLEECMQVFYAILVAGFYSATSDIL